MKKKFTLTLLTFISLLFCAFGLAACGSAEEQQTPTEPVPFTVTFETNGGTPIEAVTSDTARTLKQLLNGKTTTREGKVFDGWYSDSSLTGDTVPYNKLINTSVTFYATWRDFTNLEALTNAVNNTRAHAIAVHDSGPVRYNTASYSTVNVTLALENGSITAGMNEASSRYYYNKMFYYTDSNNEKTKLLEKQPDTAAEFLYTKVSNTVDYNKRGFYSVFAPLAMYRLVGTSDCSFARDGDTFTITYLRDHDGIQLRWADENNPWVYFIDAGKIFKFTVKNYRIVKAEQMQSTKAYRTIEFFYEGDPDIPTVSEPQNESFYVQKWQVNVNNGKKIMQAELNKATLDKKIYGDGYAQITKDQTYYYDEQLTQEVPFDEKGVAPLNEHTELYHPEVRSQDLVVDGFDISLQSSYDLRLESITYENGVKVTTYVRKDSYQNGWSGISVAAKPSEATSENKEFTVEFADKQEDDEDITITEYYGSKGIRAPKSVAREYRIKITAVKSGYTEYICIKLMA